MSFAENLKRLRRKKGISQSKLAKAVETSQSAVGYWERGQKIPSSEKAKKLAEFFNVSVDELLEDAMESFSTAIGEKIVATVDDEPMIYSYHKLNSDGQIKVIEYAEDLAGNPAYRKPDTSEE